MYKQDNYTLKCYLLLCFVVLSAISNSSLSAQETNSEASGQIRSASNEILMGATVTAIHEPTRNIFNTQSRSDGYFHFFNLKPGGPYTITVSYTGHETIKKENLFLILINQRMTSLISY